MTAPCQCIVAKWKNVLSIDVGVLKDPLMIRVMQGKRI